ncbi:DUF3822 family protein [Ferruginibacter paludis]|uniref:DUF3822 family protein n=1 Tax=Ferruginibacter paludis TaxID=1310417 RepID=UPI0025B43FC7|nr:DUF3822 family protein [Ferruginibacter paludis]MDN3657594.1 DUF3822 family protein [Ferruginibacter paludis]
MISTFNILTDVPDTAGCSLFIELSGQGISYWALSADNSCFALSVYHFSAATTNDKAADYFKDIVSEQPLLRQSFKKVSIIYAFSEALLVPARFVNTATATEMLNLVYGEEDESVTKSDLVYQLNLQNIYRIPKSVEEVVANLYPSAAHWHLYSILSGAKKDTINLLYCIFSTNHFMVQLIKNGQLQIIQQFDYKLPEDAAYYLLSICEQFGAPLKETEVVLNGMIDQESALYKELKKYLPEIRFCSLPETFTYDEGIKNYAPHYFSHLFEIAACV